MSRIIFQQKTIFTFHQNSLTFKSLIELSKSYQKYVVHNDLLAEQKSLGSVYYQLKKNGKDISTNEF